MELDFELFQTYLIQKHTALFPQPNPLSCDPTKQMSVGDYFVFTFERKIAGGGNEML